MDGRDRRAGAVAGIFGPNNPVLAARAVMEHSPHVLLVGDGAHGVLPRARASPSPSPAISTPRRAGSALQQTLAQGFGPADDDESRRHGTVGAVARDRARQSRRRDLDRRDDRQAARPGRRQPDHRRRHLCRQRELRGLGDRPRRVLHPLSPPRTRSPRACAHARPAAGRGRRGGRRRARPGRRLGRARRGRPRRRDRRCRSTAPGCIAATVRRRRNCVHRDLRRGLSTRHAASRHSPRCCRLLRRSSPRGAPAVAHRRKPHGSRTASSRSG